ncbi:GNAT family N-acetyltransferase [Priestia filamentosa]|uniref:GNAT family N-acetyltransferase n=1 Tax=Priestia filamentosa TaxID=1402861 RepID=UPI0003201016|nr:GNAT family N-acetyltransferase [Priestia filamentosa]
MKIRKASERDINEIAEIYVDSWRTTYDGLVPREFLNGLSYETSQHKWQSFYDDQVNETFMYVAVDEIGKVVGFAAARCMLHKEREGELYALYLLDQCQGQGVGRSLVKAVANHFIKSNVSSMFVWVMKNNRAGRGFYQSLKGTYTSDRQSEFGGYVVEDEAYKWDDLSLLT